MEIGFLTFTFTGINGVGNVNVAGVKADDIVIWSTFTRAGTTYYAAPGAVWGCEITADNEVPQIDGSDNTSTTGKILVFRGG